MRWPRARFTLRRLMVAVALTAICIAAFEYELRRRRSETLLRIEQQARMDAVQLERKALMDALQLACDKRREVFEWRRNELSKRRQVIYAEEWSGNPRRPNRHGLSVIPLNAIRRSAEEFKKQQDKLEAIAKELEQSLKRITESHPSEP